MALDAQAVWQTLSRLTDDEWLEVLVSGAHQDRLHGVELPGMAPDDVQMRFNANSGESNLRSAFVFYRAVKRYVAACGRTLTADSRVLDFGCGWGRLTRFFLKDVRGDNLCGVDVDRLAIATSRATMPFGSYTQIPPTAPTSYPSGCFDLIYAYSVFSHLPEPLHLGWIEEFARLLTPGGVLVVTTLRRSFLEDCRRLREASTYEHAWQRAAAESFPDTLQSLAEYDRGGYLYSPRPDSLYGMAVISPGYVTREWTRFLEFRDFVAEPDQIFQSVIAMQKPAARG